MIPTLASQCSPAVHFPQAHTTEEIRERISCQRAEFASPLYILHITTEGTMCLRWQVAIVHNVLMLTKCQFDPWDRWVGRGCGSWILKQATVWCSYGDGGRHDTDETGNYLPNGRHTRQSEGERGGKRDEEGERQSAGRMKGWVSRLKKAQRQIQGLSLCVICHHRPVALKLMYRGCPTNHKCKCLQAILFTGSRNGWCCVFERTAEAEVLPRKSFCVKKINKVLNAYIRVTMHDGASPYEASAVGDIKKCDNAKQGRFHLSVSLFS